MFDFFPGYQLPQVLPCGKSEVLDVRGVVNRDQFGNIVCPFHQHFQVLGGAHAEERRRTNDAALAFDPIVPGNLAHRKNCRINVAVDQRTTPTTTRNILLSATPKVAPHSLTHPPTI